MDFDYKKYSLENLEKWMSDALLSSEATPQEIYDVIHKVVEEEYHYFKHHTGRCYDLLALLKGNGKEHLTCDKDDPLEECKGTWNDFWEENYYPEEYEKSKELTVEDIMPPWGHSDMEALRYTEEELNAMCDKAASDQEKDKCREYNLREAEYYDKRAKLDVEHTQAKIQATSPYNDGWTQEQYQKIVDKYEGNQDKVVKWQLPVEVDGISGEYYVQFPDDLMEASDIGENDLVEWIDQGNGSYLLKKVNNSPSWAEGNKLAKTKTYDEMIAEGWSMTAEGFWIKETVGMDEC
jgi:hypothetical protein